LATQASGVRLWYQRDRAWRRRQFSRCSARPGGAIEPVEAAFRRSAVSESRQAAVAPLASEWIHYAALAIRAQIPITVLLDQVAQYPTYTEAWLAALEQLSL
jgi:hypothetical protein